VSEGDSHPVSLYDHVNALFAAHFREHEMMEEARKAAVETMSKRLEGMNEFREQLTRQEASFATKAEIRPLQQFQDRFIGIILGMTALNAIVTALIMWALRK